MAAQTPESGFSSGIARPTFTVLAGSGAALVATLAVRIVLARSLTPADVGVLILATAIATALGAAASLGLSPAAGRRIAGLLVLGQRSQAGRTARTSLLLALAAGFATVLALTSLASVAAWIPGGDAVRGLLPLLAPLVVGVAVGQAMIGVARGFGDAAGRAALRDGLGGVLRVIGVLTAIVGWGTLEAVALGFMAGAVLGELSYLAYCGVHGWFRGDPGRDRELIHSLPPYTATELVTQANAWMDVLVLGALAPASAVGYYGVARGLTRALGMGFTAATHSYLPSATALLTAGRTREFTRLYRRARTLVLAITWPLIAAMMFSPESLIGPLFGSDYLPGAAALRWLGVGILLDWLASFKDHSLLAVGRSRTVAAVATTSSAVGLALLLVMVPRHGATGAAVAVAAVALFRLATLGTIIRWRLPLRLADDLPAATAVALLLGLIGGACTLLIGATALAALLITGGVAALGSLLLLYVLWRTADRGRSA